MSARCWRASIAGSSGTGKRSTNLRVGAACAACVADLLVELGRAPQRLAPQLDGLCRRIRDALELARLRARPARSPRTRPRDCGWLRLPADPADCCAGSLEHLDRARPLLDADERGSGVVLGVLADAGRGRERRDAQEIIHGARACCPRPASARPACTRRPRASRSISCCSLSPAGTHRAQRR